MKKLLINILTLLFISNCHGQTITRHSNEDKDSFVKRIMGKSSYSAGPTYEFKDSSSIILFFEIKVLDKLPKKVGLLNKFEGVPCVTLLNVLYSKNQKEYRKSIVDTLDFNSGCCPCHYPVTVDSIFQRNKNEIIVLMIHPVKDDCNSMTTHSAVLYSDLLEKIKSDIFSVKPSLTVGYYPFVKDRTKEVLKQISEYNKKE